MRIRLPIAQAWQSAHERPYFYAGPAKGATVAAWKQAARAELGSSLRLDHAIVLLDLVKAFDNVPHDWLVRQARRHGFNLYLLRLSLAACSLARTVRIGRVCVQPQLWRPGALQLGRALRLPSYESS